MQMINVNIKMQLMSIIIILLSWIVVIFKKITQISHAHVNLKQGSKFLQFDIKILRNRI